jgi:hypothetical protein
MSEPRSNVEPWMSGPIPGVDPFVAPLLYSFQMAREDLALHTAGLTAAQVWATPHGFNSVGFHLRHIAGSTDRLMTYAGDSSGGGQLSADQMAFLRAEKEPGAAPEALPTRDALLSEMDAAFAKAEAAARALDPARLTDPRGVGRKQLPTTVIGLLVHIAEHTQRHVGQAICAAQLARVR